MARAGLRGAVLAAVALSIVAGPAASARGKKHTKKKQPKTEAVEQAPAVRDGLWSDAPLPTARGEGLRLTASPGGVVLSWVEAGDAPTLQASLWTGTEWAPTETVAVVPDLFSSWADSPIVVAGASHQAAAWLVRAGDHGAHLMVSRRAPDQPWSAPVRVHTDESATEHGFATLFPLADGTTDVAWLDGRDYAQGGSGRTGLYHRVLGATGALGMEQVIDPRTCDCCPTSGALSTGGRRVLAYRDRIGGEIRDISTARLGTGQDPVRVNDDGWEFAGCPVNGPSVVNHADGITVAWMTEAGGPKVRLAVQPEGEAFESPIDLAEGDQVLGRVAATALPDGSTLVSWVEGSEEAAEIRAAVATASTRGPVFGLGPVPGARTAGFHHLASRRDDVLIVFVDEGRLVGRSIALDQLGPRPIN